MDRTPVRTLRSPHVVSNTSCSISYCTLKVAQKVMELYPVASNIDNIVV